MKKNRIALAIFVYVLIFGGLIYLATNKLVAKIQDTDDQIQTQQLSEQIKATQVSDIPKMQQQFDEITSGKDTLNGMLLDKNDAVNLIENMENIAQQSQVDVKISVQDQQDATAKDTPVVSSSSSAASKAPATIEDSLPNKNYLKFTLSMTGSYSNVVNFMSKIENMPYYGDIISLDIKHEDQQQTAAPTVSSTTVNPFVVGAPTKTSAAATQQPSTQDDNNVTGSIVAVFYLK